MLFVLKTMTIKSIEEEKDLYRSVPQMICSAWAEASMVSATGTSG